MCFRHMCKLYEYKIFLYKLNMFHHAVGLQKILSLLESGDLDVQTHAVKVVANLAAEGTLRKRAF